MCDEAVIAEKAHFECSAQLREIARLLGKPEAIFFDRNSGPDDDSDAFELLQLWNGMNTAADRQKLLNFARTLVADQK